jgi:hypothetical protein
MLRRKYLKNMQLEDWQGEPATIVPEIASFAIKIARLWFEGQPVPLHRLSHQAVLKIRRSDTRQCA